MNHLDPDESQDRDDDIDAFEQQLRAIRPAAPAQSFSSIAEALAPMTDQPVVVSSVSTTTSMWQPILSHAATLVIGLAAGVAVMLMRQPSVPASTDTSGISKVTSSPTELVDMQSSPEVQRVASDYEIPRNMGRSEPGTRSSRFSQANLNSGPLRAFGPISEQFASGHNSLANPDVNRRSLRPADSDTNDNSNERSDDVPVDHPILSPRSLHLLLNDLTHSPISKQPVSTTEGFSS